MLLIDREIKERHTELIVNGYQAENINPASYDLTIDKIILEDHESDSYDLLPKTTIFIKTVEEIQIPDNLLGRIGEKNSRMRQGLWVTGPHYFPGHKTFMFLRVSNISPNVITLKQGDIIAQIFFEELDGRPDQTYDQREEASFNDEEKYRGLGKYESEYSLRMKKI